MILDGVWKDSEAVGVGDALLISLIAILVVFAVLIIIILVTALIEKGTRFAISKVTVNPKKENEILKDDKDAMVAVLVASIEFNKATGKSPRIKSIIQVEE